MLKDRRTYELMRPEDVGVPQTTIVLGKHSGRHAVQKRCEDLGVSPSRRDLDLVYRQMVALADRQKNVTDADLRAIVSTVCGDPPPVEHGRDREFVAQEVGYGFGV
jgi:2-isopropylmalate synthase